MNPDQKHVKDIITETIRLLCRTGLQFRHCLKIQGLLGVTVDDDQIVLIHMNDSITASSSSTTINHLNHSSKSLGLSPDVGELGSSTVLQQSDIGNSGDCFPSELGRCVEETKLNDASSNNSLCNGENSNTSHNIATTCLPITLNPSSTSEEEPAADRCTCVKNNMLCVHTEGYLTTIPISDLVSGDCVDSETAPVQLGTVSLLQPNLLQADSQAFVVTAYCGQEINQLLSAKAVEDPPLKTGDEEKLLAVKTPSSTSCNIVDMSTDVHEEQVIAEEIVMPSSSLGGSNCYVQCNASQNESLVKMEAVSKPLEHEMMSDNSYSDDSDEENYSDMSEPNCPSTQSQPGSFEPMPGVSQWSPSLQRSLSDSYSVVGGNAWNLSPSLLSGVIPAGGPHSAAYYQQQILAAAAAAAHNRAARAAAVVKTETTDAPSTPIQHGLDVKHPSLAKMSFKCEKSPTSRRLPRRPRESEEKRFRCPVCELSYYHKKHLKYHLAKKHVM